jgi:hypothetical protein
VTIARTSFAVFAVRLAQRTLPTGHVVSILTAVRVKK